MSGVESSQNRDSLRDSALDMLKGLCILLAVYGHLPRVGYLHEQLEAVVQFIYTFHMPVFVLLSGFLFSRHGSNIAKILNRLVKPYVVVGFAYIPLLCFARCSQDVGIGSMFCDVFTGHAGGALWFLYVLAIVELLALVGVTVAKRFSKTCNTVVLECVIVTMFIVIGSLILNINGGTYIRLIPLWFYTYFCIGYGVGKFCNELPASVYGIIGMGVSICFLHINRDMLGNYLWVLSLILLLTWGFRCINESKIGRGLATIGRHTFAILLFHPIFNPFLIIVFAHLLKVEGSGILVGVASLCVNIGLCFLVEYGINKTPLARIVF